MYSPFANSPYYSTALDAAAAYGLNQQFFGAQIGQESSFNPHAVNGDAVGIAQFMPQTASAYGVNRNDPTSSLYGAARYDSNLLNGPCDGSYECVAESYGTLPKSGTLTSGQQTVAAAAQAADNGMLMNAYGQPMPDLSGQSVPTTTSAQIGGCAWYDLPCYITQYGSDLLAIIVGIILLAIGLTMLRTGQNVRDSLSRSVSFAKSVPKLGVATAGELLAA